MDIENLRAKAEKATPGPWAANGDFVRDTVGLRVAMVWADWKPEARVESDAEFIAACDPQTILALIEENDRLRADNAYLLKLIRDIEEWSRQKCPCKDETPDPCPLCGARVDGVGEAGVCKAGSNLPYPLNSRVRKALARRLQHEDAK